jgi:uncharacterized membrane protein
MRRLHRWLPTLWQPAAGTDGRPRGFWTGCGSIRRHAVAIWEYRSTAPLSGARSAPVVNPITAFAALSLLFGTLIIMATPPLRGPDETAHFLRAYGIALGDVVPSTGDTQGRKGILLASRLYEGFEFFESVRVKEKDIGWFGYGPVFRTHFSHRSTPIESDPPTVFVPYGGSEGYSPVAYLPQVAAALAARALDLDFVATLYLMRFVGLAAMTAMIAYAIAISPQLAWTFVAIAMLPAALYGRSVVSADGSALAAAMLVAALWLRGFLSPHGHRPAQLSLWMMFSALTKPTNLAFVLLGLMIPTRRWSAVALATLPAIGVALFWTVQSGADSGAWRMVELTGRDPAAFDPVVKFGHWLNHPLHFPAAVIGAIHEQGLADLWRQAIGVLGLFDTVLQDWVYPSVSVLLLGALFAPLPLTPAVRGKVATTAAIVAFAYAVSVYLVCYLSFTPLEANTVWGVQGRYFVPCLPVVAISVASVVNRGLDERIRAALAISAGVLSGSASIDAIVKADWHI